ncbi:MAG: cytochrome C [Bacteroidetes bacterium]|nr:cytochrome C [Bacteroidota bacterium]
MKNALKFVGYAVAILVVAIAGLLIYLKTALPNLAKAEDLKIEYTPERVERGKYLAHHVSVCMDCHSTRDWSKFSGPLKPGTLGMGSERFDQNVGLPGVYYSKNITPEGISRYTDGELFRTITTGVSKEGKALFPLMPFTYYGRMDPDDIYSIIAYVRSLQPIKNEVPESVSDFPMNFIINTIPKKADPHPRPDTTDLLAYGAYMTNASGCRECHTRAEKGQIVEEFAFSGGREFKMPDGSMIRSSNLTQDPKTGIGKWTEEQFIQRFKIFADSGAAVPVKPGEFNTIMPWTMYADMKKKDLAAIFTYLKTVKEISNEVEKFTPAPK